MATEDYTPKEDGDNAVENAEHSSLPDLLNNTIQGSSLAFSSIYSTLLKVKEQNQQLAQSMEAMMRYVIQTKFKIDTQIDKSENTPRMIVTLENNTDYQVHIATANITLTPILEPISGDNEVDIPESVMLKHISSSQTTTRCEPVNSLFVPNPSTSSVPCILPPYAKYREVVCINTTRPTPYYGRIDIRIPVTGHETTNGINPLHLTHSFGIYIIDQIKSTTVDKAGYDKQDDGLERIYGGDFIRHTLAIPPALGLEQGMRICLDMASCVIECRIGSISEDSVKLYFFSKNKVLLGILVNELDALAS